MEGNWSCEFARFVYFSLICDPGLGLFAGKAFGGFGLARTFQTLDGYEVMMD
jgi:hypothetical protein